MNRVRYRYTYFTLDHPIQWRYEAQSNVYEQWISDLTWPDSLGKWTVKEASEVPAFIMLSFKLGVQ